MQTVGMVLIPVLIGVVGQLLLKQGMLIVTKQLGGAVNFFNIEHLFRTFTNLWVLSGFTFYFLSSLFWMVVLSKVELSFAYPLLSLGYVFVLLASIFILGEQVPPIRWLGVIAILFGVTLISRS